MSGIYIPDMELPKDGYRQLFLTAEGEIIWFPTSPQDGDIRRQVIHVPDHGRLVDGDALEENWFLTELGNKVVDFEEIKTAKTIIPPCGEARHE